MDCLAILIKLICQAVCVSHVMVVVAMASFTPRQLWCRNTLVD
jgi:hypothetical protein